MELRKSTRIGWGKRKELTGFRVVSVDREVSTMEWHQGRDRETIGTHSQGMSFHA